MQEMLEYFGLYLHSFQINLIHSHKNKKNQIIISIMKKN